MSWEQFETECYTYLSGKYKSRAEFIPLGCSDSTVPDIRVLSAHGQFYIETKSELAQCGQFVLIPNEKYNRFDYSERNKTPYFQSTEIIIDHMNKNFDYFAKAGTAGADIRLPVEVFYDWIKDFYSEKGVKFFITKSSGYLIFPIEHFQNYFQVAACYRIKRSGSAAPSDRNIEDIEKALSSNKIFGEITKYGNEYCLKTSQSVNNLKIKGEKYSYLLRLGANSVYSIRKLSNTNNANVIFRITLNRQIQTPDDLSLFEQALLL